MCLSDSWRLDWSRRLPDAARTNKKRQKEELNKLVDVFIYGTFFTKCIKNALRNLKMQTEQTVFQPHAVASWSKLLPVWKGFLLSACKCTPVVCLFRLSDNIFVGATRSYLHFSSGPKKKRFPPLDPGGSWSRSMTVALGRKKLLHYLPIDLCLL